MEVRSGGASLGAGRTIGKFGRLKLGIGWRGESWQTPTFPDFKFSQTIGDIYTRIEIDTLDRPGFPRLGMVGKLEGRGASESLGSDDSASTFLGNFGGASSLGDHTVRYKAVYATNLFQNSASPYFYRMGGFLNLSGFSNNALLGTTQSLAQLQYLYRMGTLVGIPFYIGGAGEWGGVWDYRSQMSESSGIWAGSAFAALDSGLGPIYLAYSQAEAGRYVVSLNVGQPF